MSQHTLSEQEQLRREKLAELIMLGIEPYPAPLFPVNAYSTSIKDSFTEATKEQFQEVCLAGRIMSVRDMGKANFAVDALSNNLNALLQDLIKAKPSSAKGQYLQKISLSSTMGVGVVIDQSTLTLK